MTIVLILNEERQSILRRFAGMFNFLQTIACTSSRAFQFHVITIQMVLTYFIDLLIALHVFFC